MKTLPTVSIFLCLFQLSQTQPFDFKSSIMEKIRNKVTGFNPVTQCSSEGFVCVPKLECPSGTESCGRESVCCHPEEVKTATEDPRPNFITKEEADNSPVVDNAKATNSTQLFGTPLAEIQSRSARLAGAQQDDSRYSGANDVHSTASSDSSHGQTSEQQSNAHNTHLHNQGGYNQNLQYSSGFGSPPSPYGYQPNHYGAQPSYGYLPQFANYGYPNQYGYQQNLYGYPQNYGYPRTHGYYPSRGIGFAGPSYGHLRKSSYYPRLPYTNSYYPNLIHKPYGHRYRSGRYLY